MWGHPLLRIPAAQDGCSRPHQPTEEPAMSSIVTWTRRHRLVAFFGLAFLLSWWSWPFYALDLAPTAFFPCGPLVAALVVIGVAEGRDGYRELGARMIRWRVGWTWWPVAVGTPLAVLALAAAANVALWGAPVPVLAGMAWTQLVLVAAVRFVNPLDGPLGEEPAWRGYAVPQLQARRSPLASGLVLGLIVALWHLPLVVTGQLAAVGLPITFAITLVYVWLFNRAGGSVLLVMVFHIAQGTISYGALGFTGVDAARMNWLVGVLWFAIALGVIVLDREAWRVAPPAAVAQRPREAAAR
jgi:membrane protease YdiL (CAAX protease family)